MRMKRLRWMVTRTWNVTRTLWARTPVRARSVLVWLIALLSIVLFVLWVYRFPRTGFGEEYRFKKDYVEYRPAKTLWDWLGLLVVPILLAVGGYWFTHRREELTREIESDRIQEEALQGYLDRMTDLMLERSLGESKTNDPVRYVARSRT